MDTTVAGTVIAPMIITVAAQYEEHQLVRDDLAERISPATGRTAVALCRKRYLDDLIGISDADVVVVLGAGFDTRSARSSQHAIGSDPLRETGSRKGSRREVAGFVKLSACLLSTSEIERIVHCVKVSA
ncbi:class I SAM-dependent methyltransferase [Lentzea sp. NEAU-D7]|uniref:class I SAM-dependent methyltransferase n=1 Tax=Lentzea sp. NEAU-D7 TaxID=2994667 RepID=UPI00224B4E83|nr:class I SAM-dependent methyltransferase [Lentzea sp. NEAU-D7]MCX2948823.1 class I SAM-dependent methyltransferase [Lentzea sp. NEAU-D7]